MSNLYSDDEYYQEESPAVAFNGVLRASGKRFRRQFNPNDWESSILTIRHNVLCLGMSYPCVENVIANYKGKNRTIFHSAPSVDRSVELVRRNLLNQIDGRDLARVVALEANNDILAYTVSKEEGSYYDQRHLHADFNSRTLVQQMHRRWGETVRFRQVILDYFWSPSGSWAIKHWQRSFFNENIPRLVTENLLNFGDLENDSIFVSAAEANTTEDYISSTAAVVYLPFCSHCLSQVIACYDKLSQFYTISFLGKDQLEEHTLWKATNTISPESMVGWLAKTINQEETYCKLDVRQIKHGITDAFVTKEDMLDVFNRIDRSDEVRMIKLMALRKFHPDFTRSKMQRAKPTLGLDKGGYVGLLREPRSIQKKAGINSAAAAAGVNKEASNKKQDEPMMNQMPRKRSLVYQQKLDNLKKRSVSCPQSDKLASRKRQKRDDSCTSDEAALKSNKQHERLDGESTDQSDIALEWNKMLTSFELDYRKRISSGIIDAVSQEVQTQTNDSIIPDNVNVQVTTQQTTADPSVEPTKAATISDTTNSAEPKSTPAPMAMMKIAKLRRKKKSRPSTFSSRMETENTKQDESSESTPNRNDVLMGANQHSHVGNVQFFSALSFCGPEFSVIADCFINALKSLDPPGRFMGKDEASGTWKAIDYDTAIDLVPHLADSYVFGSPSDVNISNDDCEDFFSLVQRLYNDKLKGGDSQSNISQLSDETVLAACSEIDQIPRSIPKLVDCIECATTQPTGIESGKCIEWEEKQLPPTKNTKPLRKTKARKGKSSALALALTEYEGIKKMGTSTNNTGEDALETPKETDTSVPAAVTVSISTNNSSERRISGSDDSHLSAQTVQNSTNSARDCTSEESAFRCLAEWLLPSSASCQENIGTIITALKKVSEEGNISVHSMLTEAFGEEEAALRSINGANH